MEWENILIVAILVFGIGGFRLLYPLSKRLGELLEQYLDERTKTLDRHEDLSDVHDQLQSVRRRLELVEERLDFTESLLSERGEAKELPDRPDGDGPDG